MRGGEVEACARSRKRWDQLISSIFSSLTFISSSSSPPFLPLPPPLLTLPPLSSLFSGAAGRRWRRPGRGGGGLAPRRRPRAEGCARRLRGFFFLFSLMCNSICVEWFDLCWMCDSICVVVVNDFENELYCCEWFGDKLLLWMIWDKLHCCEWFDLRWFGEIAKEQWKIKRKWKKKEKPSN